MPKSVNILLHFEKCLFPNQYPRLALKGDGWRLPTIEELSYMCTLSQLKVLGFSNEYYWSSELTPKVSHPQKTRKTSKETKVSFA